MRTRAALITAIIFLSLLHLASADGADERFLVQEFFGGFSGSRCIGLFNASSGNFVEVNLSVLSNDNYKREIEVQIAGVNSGIAYDVRANSFAQTFQLNFDDTYNITIIKRSPFYTDLTVNGEITIHHHPAALTADPPSISPSQTPNPLPSSTPSSTPSPSPLSTPIQEPRSDAELFPTTLAAVSVATGVMVGAGLLVYFKKRKR